MAEDIVRLGISVDSAGVVKADKSLKNLGQTAGTTGLQVTRSSSLMSRGFATAAKAVSALAAGITALALARQSFASAISFDAALAETSTLIEGTADQMTRLDSEAKRLASTFGGSATDQVKAFYQAISAGAETIDDASSLLDTANALAVGGVTNVTTAVDVLTTAMNVYGKENLKAADAADALFVAMKAGKTTVGEMAVALGPLLPLAKPLGVSFDTISAALAALTKGGISTAKSSRGLVAVLSAVAKPTKEASDLAKELGIDFSVTAVKTMGLVGFLEHLKDKTHGNVGQLSLLFGAIEALVPILGLTGEAGKSFVKINEDMADKAGSTTEALKKIQESLSGKLAISLGKINVLMLGFGQFLAGVLVPILTLVTDHIEFLAAAAIGLAVVITVRLTVALVSRLVPAVIASVTQLVALEFALGATSLSAALSGIAVKGLTLALVALRGALLLTGIGAIAVLIGYAILKFTELAGTLGGVSAAFSALYPVVKEVFSRMLIPVQRLGLKILGLFEITRGLAKAMFKIATFDYSGAVSSIKETITTLGHMNQASIELGNVTDPLKSWERLMGQINATSAAAEAATAADIAKKKAAEDAAAAEAQAIEAQMALVQSAANAEKMLTTEIDEQIQSLHNQIAVFGLSEGAAAKYAVQQRITALLTENNITLTDKQTAALNDSAQAIANATDKLTQMQEAKKIFDETRTALERFTAKQDDLKKKLAEGTIVLDTYNRALSQAEDKLKNATKAVEQPIDNFIGAANDAALTDKFGESFFQKSSTALSNFVVTGKGGFADFASSVIDSMKRIAAQELALQIFTLFQGARAAPNQGAFLATPNITVPSPAVPSGFAHGGRHSGGLRIVGEQGPELEDTGPSRIYNAGQTRAILSQSTSAPVINVTSNITIQSQGGASGEVDPVAAENVGRQMQRVLREAVQSEIFDLNDRVSAGTGRAY